MYMTGLTGMVYGLSYNCMGKVLKGVKSFYVNSRTYVREEWEIAWECLPVQVNLCQVFVMSLWLQYLHGWCGKNVRLGSQFGIYWWWGVE